MLGVETRCLGSSLLVGNAVTVTSGKFVSNLGPFFGLLIQFRTFQVVDCEILKTFRCDPLTPGSLVSGGAMNSN